MSLESQLFDLTTQYLESKIEFDDLACWVQEHEEEWALPPGDRASDLAGIIMLMAYEVWDGNRLADGDPESARAVIKHEGARIMGAPSRS